MNDMKMKAGMVSIGVVSAALFLKLSLPIILDFVMWELPTLWSLALSWMQPPYLYLLINCIIISIVASSKLHNHPPPKPFLEFPAAEDAVVAPPEEEEEELLKSPLSVSAQANHTQDEEKVETERDGDEDEDADAKEEFMVSRSSWIPPKRGKEKQPQQLDSSLIEKPPVSARFAHRKSFKPSPQGKTLGVSRRKRQETLESTWRTITEGRPIPLKRHLKKSETFSGSGEGSPVRLNKSETFGGGMSSSSPGSRVRREPSLSQDELNQRVEAFINKFNQEMRLQRQESLSHYRNMLSRGGPTRLMLIKDTRQ